jgi:hypothetical protein
MGIIEMGSYVPIEGEAALLLEANELVIIVADLHIGLENRFAKNGLHFPSQTPLIEDKLIKLINEYSPSKLVILGDVKHNIPSISIQEWKEIPRLFKNLAKQTNIEVFPGNHDGNLEKLIPKNIIHHPSKGSVIQDGSKRIGLLHGHTWPAYDLFDVNSLFMGHNHPAIRLKDSLGIHFVEKVWIRTKWDKNRIQNLLAKKEVSLSNLEVDTNQNIKMKIGNPEIIIFPAFHPLIKGTAFNDLQSKFLGPLFTKKCIQFDDATAHLTDGTNLGFLKNLYYDF